MADDLWPTAIGAPSANRINVSTPPKEFSLLEFRAFEGTFPAAQ
jgi:hypothetical protein